VGSLLKMAMIQKKYNLNIDIPYLNLIKNCDFTPVFIIGVPRSGTSLLYHLLAETKGVNFVNTYHVLRYGELLSNYVNHCQIQACQEIQELIDSFGMDNRGVDEIPVSPYVPEEYEFILNQSGYRMRVNSRSILLLKEICQKITYISSNPSLPILLKNPMDSYNFVFLKKNFPNAKIIFIHRNPINSINSWIKFCIKLLDSKNSYCYEIWRWYREIWDNSFLLKMVKFLTTSEVYNTRVFLAAQMFQLAYSYFLKNIKYLPTQDVYSLKYESLCQDPDKTMQGIAAFLNIPSVESINFSKRVSPRETLLLPDLEKNLNYLNRLFEPTLSYFEYSPRY
jgi:hypothetical protein